MRYQIIYLISALLSLPVFPFFLILANIARKRTGKLPDALGPSGKINGKEPVLKLAVTGESTVAGVGVLKHSEGVTGQIATWLNVKTGRSVEWEAIGTSGFTARKVNDQLAGQIEQRIQDPEIIVIMLGGNDTFELNSPLKWRKDMGLLVSRLQNDHRNARIVIANLPPVNSFTAFSPLLQWYLGGLTNLHRKVILDFPLKYRDLIYMSEKIDFDKWRKEEGRNVPMKEFFSDGVHPSALTYRLWSKQIVDRILCS